MSQRTTSAPNRPARPPGTAAKRATTMPSPAATALLKPTINPAWVVAGVLVLTAFTLLPTLSNGFVNWDDPAFLTENPLVLRPLTGESIRAIFRTPVLGGYAPLTVLSFAIEHQLFGLNAVRYHEVNLLLHLLATYLVWRVFRRLGLGVGAAGLVALLFGIHPMHVESVAWVSERKDVLFGALYLAAADRYLAWRQNARGRGLNLLLVYLFFAASLLAKIQAVTLPVTLLLFDYALGRPLRSRAWLEKLPMFLFSLGVGAMGLSFLHEVGADVSVAYTGFERLTLGAYGFSVYLLKVMVPYQLLALHPFPATGHLSAAEYAGWLGVAAYGLALVWAYRRGWQPVLMGLLFFAAHLLFLLQILPGGQGYLADHYAYLAYLGVFYLLAWGLQQRPARRWLIGLSAAVVAWVLVLMGVSFEQGKVWKNSETLWTNVIRVHDRAVTPFRNRGNFRRDEGQTELALQDYSQAIALRGNDAGVFNSRSKLYFDQGRYAEAYADVSEALRLEPANAEFMTNQASAGMAGNLLPRPEGIALLDRSLKMAPDQPNALRVRYLAHRLEGQDSDALRDALGYLRLRPDDDAMHFEAALTYRRLDQHRPALREFDEAIHLNDSKGMYFLERAKARARLGENQDARNDLALARQRGITPDPALEREVSF